MRRVKRMSSCALLLASVLAGSVVDVKAQSTGATVYEGARLITGDGNVIENSAFVVEGDRFVAAGRRADILVPQGAVRVDLTGKTVMPTMTDLHGHLGFQNVAAGTMSKDTYTRENLIDHLQRLAYHGVGAVVGIGDLVNRADGRGGRTNWGDVPLRAARRSDPGGGAVQDRGCGNGLSGRGRAGTPGAC